MILIPRDKIMLLKQFNYFTKIPLGESLVKTLNRLNLYDKERVSFDDDANFKLQNIAVFVYM